eukprot:1618199-Amphidinium_carterae.1
MSALWEINGGNCFAGRHRSVVIAVKEPINCFHGYEHQPRGHGVDALARNKHKAHNSAARE